MPGDRLGGSCQTPPGWMGGAARTPTLPRGHDKPVPSLSPTGVTVGAAGASAVAAAAWGAAGAGPAPSAAASEARGPR